MARIRVISPDEAQGELREGYETIARERGMLAALFIAHSVRPKALAASFALYREANGGESSLDPRRRGRLCVALAVAHANVYGRDNHARALRELGEPAEVVDALARGETPPALAPLDRALVDFVRRVAVTPREVSAADLDVLRAFELDDGALFDVVLLAAYFAYGSTLVHVLGVDTKDDRR